MIIKKFWFICLTAFVFSLCAFAEPSAENPDRIPEQGANNLPPATQFIWDGQDAQPYQQESKTETKWVWSGGKNDPGSRLVLRSWIAFPSGTKIKSWKGNALSLKRNAPDSPFPKTDSPINLPVYSIDTISPLTEIAFVFENDNGEKKNVTLRIQLDFNRPFFWLNDSCLNLGLRIVKVADSKRFLFAAGDCVKYDDYIDFTLSYSSDVKFIRTSFRSEDNGTPQLKILKVRVPDRVSENGVKLGTFVIAETTNNEEIENALWVLPQATAPRLSWALGAGVTYMNYSETLTAVKLQQSGITPKLSATYRLPGRMFDIGGNAFLTALTLHHSPSSVKAGRVYGANFRLGYVLPIDVASQSELKTLFGWYFWSLRSPDSSYGVNLLSGPQVFLSFSKLVTWKNSIFCYVKFAPISPSFSEASFGNREIAAGGGYSFRSEKNSRPLTLTLDLADTRFGGNVNSLAMTSGTLGVQTNF